MPNFFYPQVKYHMGNHGNIAINDNIFEIDYHSWSLIHKISIVVLTVLMFYHVYYHWKWYKAVITKRLVTKNQQVLILSLLFVLDGLYSPTIIIYNISLIWFLFV